MFSHNTALLVIDVQKAFDNASFGHRNNPDAELNIKKLIVSWRESKRPLIFIQHASSSLESSFHPSKESFAIKDEVAPMGHETVIVKNENSAFIDTPLEMLLKKSDIRDIVVVGLTTDHCVSTTTRMGQNLGFNMTIVSDATATFDRVDHTGKLHVAEDIHEINLASLHQEFATVLDTKNMIAQLCQRKKSQGACPRGKDNGASGESMISP